MRKGPAPKFDHDAARARRAAGEPYGRIAADMGVSYAAVRRVCDPEMAARMAARTRKYYEATCEDCGGRAAKNWYSERSRKDRTVCKSCSIKRDKKERARRPPRLLSVKAYRAWRLTVPA